MAGISPPGSAASQDWVVVQDSPKLDPKEQKYNFFFYGTLLVPAILVRVLGHDCSALTFQDALLPEYTRHCVKGEDYPAVIGRDKTAELVPKEQVLFPEDLYTRGTVVKGLSYADVQALDIFEGTQYSRVKLPVQTLSPPRDLQNLPQSLTDPTTRQEMNQAEAVQAAKHLEGGTKPTEDDSSPDVGEVSVWVYVWSDDLSGLEPNIWRFNDFLKDKAHVWTGMDTAEYVEVDRHRALASLPGYKQGPASSPDEIDLDGEESKILGKKMEGFEDYEFGHGMKRFFKFDKDYVNLNHGSYGSPPIPVIDAMRKLSDQIESFPDRFMRQDWLPLLNHNRNLVAKMIGAQQDEVVIVPNATHGVNNIVTQINWQEGDIIVIYSATYGAVAQTMKHLCDRIPGLRIEVIELTFPCSHASVVTMTEEVLSKYNKPSIPSYTGESKPSGVMAKERVRMVVVDSICSMPGLVYPWEKIVKLCKKYGVLSLVDGAHSIGQHKVDVAETDCDFFVTNCHKWLLSHRGGAVLYVPLRNQHMIRSSFPTSAGYESTKYPSPGHREWSWSKQYEWTGTLDWTPYLTISDAIAWREKIGGEERIMAYNHSLAVQGGRRLRKKFGLEVMENKSLDDGELTACMVNVFLPNCGAPKDLEDRFLQLTYFNKEMFDKKVFAAVYWHAERWIARFSAQIWLEMSDFEHVGQVLMDICERIRRGEYQQVEVKPTDTLHAAEDMPMVDQ